MEEHKAPVSLLTAGGSGGEWLASADLAGAVNIFSLDGFFHHASVPVGRGAATALGFDSSGRYLVVATTAHVVTLFDIESQSLHADIPPFDIPKRHLAVHARVCGIAAFPEAPEKLLLWGHNYLLAVNVKAKKVTRSEAAAEPYTWRLWAGIRHLVPTLLLQCQAAEAFGRWRCCLRWRVFNLHERLKMTCRMDAASLRSCTGIFRPPEALEPRDRFCRSSETKAWRQGGQTDSVAVLDISDSHWFPDASAEVSLLPTGLAMEAGEVPGKGQLYLCLARVSCARSSAGKLSAITT